MRPFFTAGIDDRQFKRGLQGVARETKRAEGLLKGAAKVGLGVFAGASAIGTVRKMWLGAGAAVKSYTQQNMFAREELARLDRQLGQTGQAFGRMFTTVVIEGKKAATTLGLLSTVVVSSFDQNFVSGQKGYEKKLHQEALTRGVMEDRLYRSIGGPMQERLLGLQGNPGEAARVAAKNKYDDTVDKLNDLLRSGQLPGWHHASGMLRAKSIFDLETKRAGDFERDRDRMFRNLSGSVEADNLRLQGREGAAGVLEAKTRFADFVDQLDDMLRSGRLTQSGRDSLFDSANKRLILEAGEAARRDVRSFGGEIPRHLRAAVSGAVFPGQASSSVDKAERGAEERAKRAEGLMKQQNETAKRILKAFGRNFVAVWGP